MTELQSVIDTLDNAADSFSSIANKEQKKIYEEVITLAKDLETDSLGKVKQSIANLKRLTQIKAHLANLSKDKEWVAGISNFAKYFGVLQKQQNAYFSDHFPELTLSETAKKKHEMMKQLAVQNTMEGLMGSGLKANVTDKLNDILLRAVTTNAKFADLQEELHTHLLGKDGGDGAFARYATTYATTALSQFTGQNNKLLTDDLDCEWFMYTGSNKETTREFCQHLTAKKYVHRSEIPTILTGKIDDYQCKIYDKTGLPYGMIEGTNVDNFQCNCGGWNCRHQLVPVADAVVPAALRAKFANIEQKKEAPNDTKQPIDITPYKEKISTIEQYIADHPKSAKIKGYLADINGAADSGDEEQLKALLQAAQKDIAKFNAAKNSVAKKKAAIEQAKADELSAANAAQLQAAKDYATKQVNQYGSYVAFADLFDKQAQALLAGDPVQAFQIADQIDELAKNISALDNLIEPMKWAQTYSFEELKQANDYVKGHIQHWINKGKSGEQLIDAITNEMDNFLDKNHKTYDVVHHAFEQKAKETLSDIEKVKFNENNDIIHQYTIDHPKSAKIKNYYDQIIDFEFQGKHDEAVALQTQALADIKKFNAAAKSVANKKTIKSTENNTRPNEKATRVLEFLKTNELVYHHVHKYADIEDALKKGNIERATRYINDCLKAFSYSTLLSNNNIPSKIDEKDIGGDIQMTTLADVTCNNLSSSDINKLTKFYKQESGDKSDKRLRGTSEEQWKKLSAEEKLVITKYTQTYNYLNEPLRNKTYYGNRTTAECERDVISLTNALTKCRTTEDMVVRRGVDDYAIRELMKNLSDVNVGDKFTEGAFLSTSVHRDFGFHSSINLIIYIPKGSMGFYVEPASHYTDGGKYDFGMGGADIKIWDGKTIESLHNEREWIGQRGSRFEVVKKQGNNIYLKLIGQLYKQP